jgi:pimeloyl-ACP methyl ester carboxylesterase
VTQRFVDSADGVRLAVFEQGNPDGPPLVMVHGWPNSHVMWDGVAPTVADRFRIITYDNRGAGGSDVPKPVRAYTMPKFADDFAAVLAELSPSEPVHVLAHDWGSVGVWEYLRTGSRRSHRCQVRVPITTRWQSDGPSCARCARPTWCGPSQCLRGFLIGSRSRFRW